MKISHSSKLDTIQAVLQTFKAKFKNKKISTTIYSNKIIVLFYHFYKEAILDHMLCGCRLQFLSQSESLVFTLNPSLYTSMSLCSLPNGLLFTLILSPGFVLLSSVTSICMGGGGVRTRRRGRFGWVSLRRCTR